MHTPFPYQAEGIPWLAERPRAMLADEPGLGKTLQVIRAADQIGALSVLIICPAALCENWRREIRAQRQGDWTAFVISYDMARDKYRKFVFSRRWCVLALDEGHYLKSPNSQRTRLVYGDFSVRASSMIRAPQYLAQYADYIWVVTGTPMPNHAGELYTHIRTLAPERIVSKNGYPLTNWMFVRKYCKIKPGFSEDQIVGTKNHDKLNEMLNGFMLRRLVKDVLPDLPPIMWHEFYVEPKMTDTELGLDPDIQKQVLRDFERKGIEGLERINHVATLRRVTGKLKIEPAVQYIREFLECTDQKIVVFAYSIEVVEGIAKDPRLRACSVNVLGRKSTSARQKAVDKFQNDPFTRVFVAQINAAGTGFTLTAASDLLFVEQSWVPADNAQAAKRIHRIGQTDACRIRSMMFSGSIDEVISKAVMRKSRDIAHVVDGVENVENRE